SVYRYHRGLLGRRTRRIAAGLMVLGFDIPNSEARAFGGAFENSRRMLESIGIDLWSMATNFRDVVCAGWEPGHGTAIAACAQCRSALNGRFAPSTPSTSGRKPSASPTSAGGPPSRSVSAGTRTAGRTPSATSRPADASGSVCGGGWSASCGGLPELDDV